MTKDLLKDSKSLIFNPEKLYSEKVMISRCIMWFPAQLAQKILNGIYEQPLPTFVLCPLIVIRFVQKLMSDRSGILF